MNSDLLDPKDILPPGPYSCDVSEPRIEIVHFPSSGAILVFSYTLSFTTGPFAGVSLRQYRRLSHIPSKDEPTVEFLDECGW